MNSFTVAQTIENCQSILCSSHLPTLIVLTGESPLLDGSMSGLLEVPWFVKVDLCEVFPLINPLVAQN